MQVGCVKTSAVVVGSKSACTPLHTQATHPAGLPLAKQGMHASLAILMQHLPVLLLLSLRLEPALSAHSHTGVQPDPTQNRSACL